MLKNIKGGGNFILLLCHIENNDYLCIEQLVILIYIYHFPRRKLSVKMAFFLFTDLNRASADSHYEAYN